MKSIKVDKQWLIKTMETNRSNHREVFEAALEGWRNEATELIGDTFAALQRGKTPNIQIILPRPEDHTRDYTRVIGMLKADIGDTYELSETDYSQYVDDDWSWKRQWAMSNSGYAGATYAEVYGNDE